jgi:hypothetical protein
MEFAPAISPNLKEKDPRIFKAETIHATSDFFGLLKEKCIYLDEIHVMYLVPSRGLRPGGRMMRPFGCIFCVAISDCPDGLQT